MVGFNNIGIFGGHVPPADGIPVPGLGLRPGGLGLRGFEFRGGLRSAYGVQMPPKASLKARETYAWPFVVGGQQTGYYTVRMNETHS